MEKKIIWFDMDGVEYELTPKKVLTDEEFVKYVLEKNKINFNIGDIVWYKEQSVRKECGETKFKVLSIEPYLIDNRRIDSYLNVNLESLTSGNKISFFTSHLEKYTDKDFVKEITIDGVDYELIPKQKYHFI